MSESDPPRDCIVGGGGPGGVLLALRLPFVRDIPARIIALGFGHLRLENP